jgi:DNA-binding Xre family transcriptional regulator
MPLISLCKFKLEGIKRPMITSNLKYVMRKKGVTINKLIEMSGVSNHTIVRARRTTISECALNTLEKIADALDCKVKDLFVQERNPDKLR